MRRMSRPPVAAVLVIAALGAGPTRAAEGATEPLWEAGIGAGALEFPDYRGSSHRRVYGLPVPYFVYRGRFLQADRRGLRGVFLDTDRVDLNLSVGASLPVASGDNPARAGMPDLKPAVELGPSLELTLWRADDRRAKVDLRLPVRAAFAVGSGSRFIGTQFSPNLNLDIVDPSGFAGWNLGLLAGPVYTDRRYNRYFYEVAPEFATAGRSSYTPSGGYAGTEFILALSKRFPRFWLGGFARYDTLRGAAFEASPLVTSRNYVAGGVGISWIVGESKEQVPVTELGTRRR